MTFDPRRWRAPGVPPSEADPADETAASRGRLAPLRQTPQPMAAAPAIPPVPVQPFGPAGPFDAAPLDALIATSGPLALQAQARLRLYGAPDILAGPRLAAFGGPLAQPMPDTGPASPMAGFRAATDAETLDALIATSGPLALQAQARIQLYGVPDILTAPMPASGAGNLSDPPPDTGPWPLPQLAQFTAAPPPAPYREPTDTERDDAQRRQADQPCLKELQDAMATQKEGIDLARQLYDSDREIERRRAELVRLEAGGTLPSGEKMPDPSVPNIEPKTKPEPRRQPPRGDANDRPAQRPRKRGLPELPSREQLRELADEAFKAYRGLRDPIDKALDWETYSEKRQQAIAEHRQVIARLEAEREGLRRRQVSVDDKHAFNLNRLRDCQARYPRGPTS